MMPIDKNLDRSKSQFLTTLMFNSGDALERISVLKAEATRQDLKVGTTPYLFRDHLLTNGLAHSFYQGFLWMMPVVNKRIEDLNLEQILANFFTKRLEIKAEEIADFSDDYLWLQVGLVLLRDAIRCALFEKLGNANDMIVSKLRVYDKKQIVQANMTVYTILGVSLARILPVDTNNIGLSPIVVYDVYSFNRRITDKYERQKYITKASRCSFSEYFKRLNHILNRVLPLTVNFSNKVLTFKLPYYEIIKREEKKQRSLEEWF
jgi:hypothetical protein